MRRLLTVDYKSGGGGDCENGTSKLISSHLTFSHFHFFFQILLTLLKSDGELIGRFKKQCKWHLLSGIQVWSLVRAVDLTRRDEVQRQRNANRFHSVESRWSAFELYSCGSSCLVERINKLIIISLFFPTALPIWQWAQHFQIQQKHFLCPWNADLKRNWTHCAFTPWQHLIFVYNDTQTQYHICDLK